MFEIYKNKPIYLTFDRKTVLKDQKRQFETMLKKMGVMFRLKFRFFFTLEP